MSKNSEARKRRGQLVSFVPTGEYYFSKGLKAFHRRDFHKASKYLMRAMQLEPGEPMIACQLAIVYTEMGEYQQSNRLLHMILEELDEEMAECHYFLANNYAHLGFFKDSYTHANTYLELDEDGEFAEETIDLLELLSLEADDLDEDVYEQDDLITKQEQARELLESGNFPKAVELLKSVIKEFPEYWSAYNNLALGYFYLGEIEKASGILQDVLKRNPGNLHALCNMLVFAHYLQDISTTKSIIDMLKKVKPLLLEHQLKLGTTFALTGEYEYSFYWLRKLQKQGFEGDAVFFYWLSHAAFFTGREQLAHSLWKKVLEHAPEKEGFEPWNTNPPSVNGFEEHVSTIIKKLDSDYMEERLFALFLTSLSDKKESILTSEAITKNIKFSELETQYVSMIRTGKKRDNSMLAIAHDTAVLLYEHHQPIGSVEASLYLMWFSVFIEMVRAREDLKNKKALAAAMEYMWHKMRNQKISQQQMARQYELSPSTIQKYVKIVNMYME